MKTRVGRILFSAAVLIVAVTVSAQTRQVVVIDSSAPTHPFPHFWEQMFGSGRAELTADTNGTHHSEFDVDLKPLSSEAAESAKADILKALADFPGVNFSLNTFLTERINETLSGYTAPVVVNVYGRLFCFDDETREPT